MTSHYEELSDKESVFGQLRNCMDLAVLAALISHNDLPGKVGWDMAVYLDPDFKAKRWNAPRTVHTLASYVQKRSGLVVQRFGRRGDQSLADAGSAQEKPELDATRQQAAARTTNWWWD